MPAKEGSRDGEVESIAVDWAPPGLLKVALKATGLIGSGLYGVDMKRWMGNLLCGVNDNPNIDAARGQNPERQTVRHHHGDTP